MLNETIFSSSKYVEYVSQNSVGTESTEGLHISF